nr:MAG TPA_asm: hypothetical protein [Caudoviricetes sp.]
MTLVTTEGGAARPVRLEHTTYPHLTGPAIPNQGADALGCQALHHRVPGCNGKASNGVLALPLGRSRTLHHRSAGCE